MRLHQFSDWTFYFSLDSKDDIRDIDFFEFESANRQKVTFNLRLIRLGVSCNGRLDFAEEFPIEIFQASAKFEHFEWKNQAINNRNRS